MIKIQGDFSDFGSISFVSKATLPHSKHFVLHFLQNFAWIIIKYFIFFLSGKLQFVEIHSWHIVQAQKRSIWA